VSVMYAFQEHLELVTERSDLIIQNKDLGRLFDGFDFITGTYRVPHMLRYVFPLNHTTSPVESVSQDAAEAQRVYQAIDELLVDMLAFLRKSFALTRTNDAARPRTGTAAAQVPTAGSETASVALSPAVEGEDADLPVLNMQDLLMLLRFASTHNRGLHVEGLLWTIWLSHSSPDISKLMRLSGSYAARGHLEKAVELSAHASVLDPAFAEPYNKRASYHHHLGQYDECIEYSQKALAIFPDHFAAYSGLALANERKGGFCIQTVRA
jgi:tetratricopeptide (TPR) repeat protein